MAGRARRWAAWACSRGHGRRAKVPGPRSALQPTWPAALACWPRVRLPRGSGGPSASVRCGFGTREAGSLALRLGAPSRRREDPLGSHGGAAQWCKEPLTPRRAAGSAGRSSRRSGCGRVLTTAPASSPWAPVSKFWALSFRIRFLDRREPAALPGRAGAGRSRSSLPGPAQLRQGPWGGARVFSQSPVSRWAASPRAGRARGPDG